MAEVGSAYVSLMPSMSGFGSKMNSGLSGEVNKSGSSLGKTFGKVFAGVAALGLASKVGGFLKDSIAEAREAQVVTARTENVIKSMGLTSIVSAGQIGKLAMSISNKTAVDDEAIQSGQNLLLTFKNVAKTAGQAGGVFDMTSQLMVDMSKAMGTDMKGSALQLGKALNDPIKGVSALTRVGVSFSEGQKKQIAGFVESGNLAKAQGVILGELQNQFGGAAASMATPAEKLAVSWGNFKETIGTALLPVLDKFFNFINSNVVPVLSKFFGEMQSGTGAGGRFADKLREIWATTQQVAVSVWETLQPALKIFGEVIRDQVVPAIQKIIAKFREWWPSIQPVVSWLAKTWAQALELGLTIASKVIPPIVRFASFLIGRVVESISRVVGWIKTAIEHFTDFVGKVKEATDKVPGLSNVINGVIAVVKKLVGWIGDAIAKLTELIGLKNKASGDVVVDGYQQLGPWGEDPSPRSGPRLPRPAMPNPSDLAYGAGLAGRGSMMAKLDQLIALQAQNNAIAASQGNEFGRALNGAASAARVRAS